MSDEKPRRKGRPPTHAEPYGRLYANVQQEAIAALAMEAHRRGISLSELTRGILMEWMQRELPPGQVPHPPSTAQTGVQTPVTVEQSAYQGDETNRSNQ
jgi:hypothetical protein